MAYRDDREALRMQVESLERDNERLHRELEAARAREGSLRDERDRVRQRQARGSCVQCGGTLLPVAVFAGHDVAAPLPLHLSTLRFVTKKGGFTHAAPLRASACASCGFIHFFVDFERPGGDGRADPGEVLARPPELLAGVEVAPVPAAASAAPPEPDDRG